jgi:hypothetical protein
VLVKVKNSFVVSIGVCKCPVCPHKGVHGGCARDVGTIDVSTLDVDTDIKVRQVD